MLSCESRAPEPLTSDPGSTSLAQDLEGAFRNWHPVWNAGATQNNNHDGYSKQSEGPVQVVGLYSAQAEKAAGLPPRMHYWFTTNVPLNHLGCTFSTVLAQQSLNVR
jgi:hypothetical protein